MIKHSVMKQYFILIATLLIACASCTQTRTKEDKIKEAFDDYVYKNFDDPSAVEGIVSIDSLETISTAVYKQFIIEIYAENKKLQNLCNTKDSLVQLYVEDERYKYMVFIKGMYSALSSSVQLLEQHSELIKNKVTFEAAENDLEEINNLPDTTFYELLLSYRIKTKDGLKLERCYVYSDTSYNHVQILPSRLKAGDPPIDNLYNKINEFQIKYEPLFNLYQERLKIETEMLSMLRSEYGEYSKE